MTKQTHWPHLHDSDGSVGDGGPVDGAHHDAGSSEGSGLRDEPVSQVQHVDHGTWWRRTAGSETNMQL